MKLYYDFHIHSCLSPCGDNDMTPNNIVNFAKIMGYDVIALTDHNTALNCPAVAKIAEENGITFIPGMELCTSEEVHIVCLFYTLDDALSFSEYVKSTMPPIKNKPSVFGEQLICDENDNVIGQEGILLVTASGISTEKVVKKVAEYNGICYPAHIDRSSFSILSNLGTIDEYFGFKCAEIYDILKEDELKEKHPYLNKLKILSDSDAHYLENMRLPQQVIEVPENNIKTILDYLNKKGGNN
ncbi:MAG: PHP domain-containing protein [Acutalibacteraceae bacterium]|nr:PHP domain-containing protein [Acutalibacteraceae bacterium]